MEAQTSADRRRSAGLVPRLRRVRFSVRTLVGILRDSFFLWPKLLELRPVGGFFAGCLVAAVAV
jgi:hypothetical protein